MTNPTYRITTLPNKTREAELALGPTDEWIEFLQVDRQYLFVDGKRFPLKLLDQLVVDLLLGVR